MPARSFAASPITSETGGVCKAAEGAILAQQSRWRAQMPHIVSFAVRRFDVVVQESVMRGDRFAAAGLTRDAGPVRCR